MYFDNQENENKKESKLYDILGLDSNASANDIRKAYRKLVAKHHPDKGGDKEKFQELQNAYEILSDEEQRKTYDKYGEEGLKKGFNTNDQSQYSKPKAPTLLFTLRVQLEDIYTGIIKELEISRERKCIKCKGTGSKHCVNTTCDGCKGKGATAVLINTNIGLMQQKVKCMVCNGKGNILFDEDKCGDCDGKRIINDKKILNVEVEKGAPDGKRYNFQGEGNDKDGYETGDVHVELFLENKTRFERKGADLATTIQISIIEALTNFEIELIHLDGKPIYIRNKEIIQPGTIKTIKDCGLPFYGKPFNYGNLYISFVVAFPKVDKDTQEKLLEVYF